MIVPSTTSFLIKATVWLLLLPAMVQATSFEIENDMECSYAQLSYTATCDGEESCNLGETMTVTGTATLLKAFPSTVCLTVKTCMMGFTSSMFCREYTENNVDFCNALGLTPTSGAECPNQGSYAIDTSTKLPGETVTWGSNWWLTVYTTVEDCSGSEVDECKSTIKAVRGRSSTSASLLGVAALVSAAAAYYNRKRRVAKIDLITEEEKAMTGHFEMMADSAVRV